MLLTRTAVPSLFQDLDQLTCTRRVTQANDFKVAGDRNVRSVSNDPSREEEAEEEEEEEKLEMGKV